MQGLPKTSTDQFTHGKNDHSNGAWSRNDLGGELCLNALLTFCLIFRLPIHALVLYGPLMVPFHQICFLRELSIYHFVLFSAYSRQKIRPAECSAWQLIQKHFNTSFSSGKSRKTFPYNHRTCSCRQGQRSRMITYCMPDHIPLTELLLCYVTPGSRD